MKIYIKFRCTMLLTAMLLTGLISCKKDFGEINSNPKTVTTPDIKFLFTYSQDKVVTYQGTEWVWESLEQLMRFTQHITTDPYELTNNVNTRYNQFYANILPNLFEIRKQIAAKPDKDNYRKMEALTYILQVLHGIKVTDMNGSIPYTQAMKGRYEGGFSPVYDKQEVLFDTWLQELDNAISVISNNGLPNQNSYGTADVYYKGDWIKWVKLANSLKLRIAARLESQNNAKTRTIFQQVMQNPNGAIETLDDQLNYQNMDYLPFGSSGDINYRSTRYATISIMKFLKSANDPRIGIYFEQNDLRNNFRDSLIKYNVTLPSFISLADPLIMYQGGPAEFNTNPTIANYLKNSFPVGPTARYFLISPINRRFFSPRYNNVSVTAQFREVVLSTAETCFQIAEFVQKGYAGGANTRGTAEDWYKKGIAASIKSMDNIATAAGLPTVLTGDGSTEINAYLANANVAFNGVNNLERIYIQQYLNLFRSPNEAFVFSRRTGYPKFSSTYYAREVFNEVIPRRFWTTDPGEVNRANWNTALSEQGFTPNAQDVPTLNSQRIWYDKNAPAFGNGQ
ncbi:SusD/RagB family nutrient-binding outer membrane lipoprotein [Pedobacter nyackensis]|uniref:SusD/RagB family nutrient-binding outer membrane lipoprotein n=1 Tax=Pedobacter nyackensis TaxID=475255 RepID=UPI00292D2880|nr:SusD/RagB family nutrient-binding outer membrane lipoprotein [Pedobacter nyackensis]